MEEAQEKAREAQIERNVEDGKITKEEAQRRKDIAREQLADNTARLDLKKGQQRITEHQRQLEEAAPESLPRKKPATPRLPAPAIPQ